jgi:endoglucanase
MTFLRSVFAAAALLAVTAAIASSHSGMTPLKVAGRDLVNDKGTPVSLRGVNLGNWFLFEMWMMDAKREGGPADHVALLKLLESRFGSVRVEQILDVHRSGWITERDFKLIRSAGFNVVRLPIHHGLIEDPSRPGELRQDAFKWVDHAVKLAAAEGIYTIIDMHGAPGGQSLDHVCGETGRNEFWLPENRLRGAKLWEAIARHYRDNPAVVAYDLLNEPYNRMDMTHDDTLLITAMGELINAVRGADPEKLIYVAGTFRGIEFYGPPAARGWHNVGYTEHFYPGLYGDEASLFTQARFLEQKVPARAALLKKWNAPFLVGEFNPVLLSSGGADMLRMHFDRYAAEGWAATMWSHKLVSRRGGTDTQPWTLVKNREPITAPDFTTASADEIEAYFRKIGDMDYAESTAQLEALRAPEPRVVALPAIRKPEPAPEVSDTGEWMLTDIGDAYPRAAMRISAGELMLWGGGRDLFSKRDEFGFCSRPVNGDFAVSAEVTFEADVHKHAKAGLMARAGLDDDDLLVMVHIFPDDSCVAAIRRSRGAPLEQFTLGEKVSAGARLFLERKGDTFIAGLSRDGRTMSHTMKLPVFPSEAQAGPFMLSHDIALSKPARFIDLKIAPSKLPKPVSNNTKP